PSACESIAKFGNGVGIGGAGGAGTLHTSGNANAMPPALVESGNTIALLSHDPQHTVALADDHGDLHGAAVRVGRRLHERSPSVVAQLPQASARARCELDVVPLEVRLEAAR